MTGRLLVLGGTAWLGGAVARHGLERGLEVTCLARGSSGQVPAGARLVATDRHADDAYAAVAGEPWDLVVEVSWQPELVRSALDALAGDTTHWAYVSSSSVYADGSRPGGDESSVLLPAWDGEGTAAEHYGEAKVLCERLTREVVDADRLLVGRIGLIGGHGDRSDRLGYWPARAALAHGDRADVLVPDALDQFFQVVDVEDVASWLVRAGLDGSAGTFDVVGEVTTLGETLDLAARVAGTTPRWRPAAPDWLLAEGVTPWMGSESLPLWVPGDEEYGFLARSGAAAVEAGFARRPLEDTVTAALAWETGLGLDRPRRAGLSPDFEAALLARLDG